MSSISKHYQELVDEVFGFGYSHRTLRTCFDPYAAEWNHTTLDKKVSILAKLVQVKPLQFWVDGYTHYYTKEVTGKDYVVKDLPEALRVLLSDCENTTDERIINLRMEIVNFLFGGKIFTSKQQVLELISRTDNRQETEYLIGKISDLKKQRLPFYLTFDEFDEILKWKLRGQYKRQLNIRERNTDSNVRLLTQTAFLITHSDKALETGMKINTLRVLSGVEIPVASAILALCYPDKYAVIDYRNWRRFHPTDKNKTTFTISEYNSYLTRLNSIAQEYGLTVQEVDIALWQYDIEHSKNESYLDEQFIIA